jgi:hypothetical protein
VKVNLGRVLAQIAYKIFKSKATNHKNGAGFTSIIALKLSRLGKMMYLTFSPIGCQMALWRASTM